MTRVDRHPWLRRPAGRDDELSLEERFGLLSVVRLGLAAAVLAASIAVPSEVGVGPAQVALPCAAMVVLAVAVAVAGGRGRRTALLAHRLALPLDTVFLVVVTVPSGGPRSQLLVLFSVHLVATALLTSTRSALRVALWDAVCFIAVAVGGAAAPIGALIGVRTVMAPSARSTAMAVMGFWAVALAAAACSRLSERELRRNRRELEALTVMAAQLEVATDPDGARRTLLAHTAAAVGATRAVLVSSAAVHLAVDGLDAPRTVGVPPGDDALVDEARRSRQPLARARIDRAASPLSAALLPGARNVIAVAVGGQADAPVLVLELGGRHPSAGVARRTLLLAAEFAAHGAMALATTTLLAERGRLADLDGLTGLANRRTFDRCLTRELAAAGRRGEHLTLVLMDIDHFKAVNDNRGHTGGDEVLRALARVLQATCRTPDVVARYGGEEFAVLLPGCGAGDAVALLERITDGVAADADLAGITFSSGIASVPEHAGDGPHLIEAADRALYDSKRAGRNRATVAGNRSGRPRH